MDSGHLSTRERTALTNALIQRYWKPVYCYLRRRGYGNEEAKDLTQSFFVTWIEKDLPRCADPARGRFRALLLTALKNFVKNEERYKHAKRRHPSKGIVSIHELASGEDRSYEPEDRHTPEDAFHRAWVVELLMTALAALEEECRTTGKEEHYELFRVRIVDPALHGTRQGPLRELAQQQGIELKQADNRLLTTRRAYQRLLREEIGSYALSEEEIASEVQDLFCFLAKS